MTMPILVANSQKKVIATKVKKIYSDLTQTVKLSEVDNGDKVDWIYNYGSTQFYETYLKKYVKSMKDCGNNYSECFPEKYTVLDGKSYLYAGNISHFYVMPDGTSVRLVTFRNYATLYYDITGLKKPNQVSKDIFCFDIYPDSVMPCYYGIKTRDNLVRTNGTCSSDKTGSGLGCAMLMMIDNWEIKADYPW